MQIKLVVLFRLRSRTAYVTIKNVFIVSSFWHSLNVHLGCKGRVSKVSDDHKEILSSFFEIPISNYFGIKQTIYKMYKCLSLHVRDMDIHIMLIRYNIIIFPISWRNCLLKRINQHNTTNLTSPACS